MEPLLQLEGVRAGYGEAVVLDGISMSLEMGGSLAVLGRNGVGKTTLLATIMGHTTQHLGRIRWRGTDLTEIAPHRRGAAGLGWVVQERGIFPSLSVEENLAVAACPGPWTVDRVYELFPRLRERRRNGGTQLSGGEQQMLAIGRGLVGNPTLLMLDEPLEGLAPIIVQELSGAIRTLMTQEGLSLILVEQHARVALQLTRHAIVLDRGRVVYSGRSSELLDDPGHLRSMLGAGARQLQSADRP